jgi:hypothetical protein
MYGLIPKSTDHRQYTREVSIKILSYIRGQGGYMTFEDVSELVPLLQDEAFLNGRPIGSLVRGVGGGRGVLSPLDR